MLKLTKDFRKFSLTFQKEDKKIYSNHVYILCNNFIIIQKVY